MDGRDSNPDREVELGEEVMYQGKRWMLDDEALIGREGQQDIVFNTLAPEEFAALLGRLRPADEPQPPGWSA